jgi:hypothetical protein
LFSADLQASSEEKSDSSRDIDELDICAAASHLVHATIVMRNSMGFCFHQFANRAIVCSPTLFGRGKSIPLNVKQFHHAANVGYPMIAPVQKNGIMAVILDDLP